MKAKQISALVRVADASFMAAQAKLASLREQESILRHHIDQLRADRGRQIAERPVSNDPALKAGADALWFQWIAARQTSLNTELAQLNVQKAQQFDVVKNAFGRRQAMRALADKSKMEARLVNNRRQSV